MGGPPDKPNPMLFIPILYHSLWDLQLKIGRIWYENESRHHWAKQRQRPCRRRASMKPENMSLGKRPVELIKLFVSVWAKRVRDETLRSFMQREELGKQAWKPYRTTGRNTGRAWENELGPWNALLLWLHGTCYQSLTNLSRTVRFLLGASRPDSVT
jgi:hypothetical protein